MIQFTQNIVKITKGHLILTQLSQNAGIKEKIRNFALRK